MLEAGGRLFCSVYFSKSNSHCKWVDPDITNALHITKTDLLKEIGNTEFCSNSAKYMTASTHVGGQFLRAYRIIKHALSLLEIGQRRRIEMNALLNAVRWQTLAWMFEVSHSNHTTQAQLPKLPQNV